MKIGLPGNKSNNKDSKKTIHKIKKKAIKLSFKDIRWRDNVDTLSAKIGGQFIYIDKKKFDIQLNNGFIIKCYSIEDAKSKAFLLFNN